MDYTQKMYDQIYRLWGEDDENIENKVVAFLGESESFQSFSDGLKTLINSKMPDTYEFDELQYLKDCADKNDVTFNRNTINNWFSGARPKKGDESRRHMYMISFALKLNIKETSELFRKVYYDKPFNFRDPKEFIFYYCIKNGHSYSHACEMISRIITRNKEYKDKTMYTRFMSQTADTLVEDEEVISYILKHPHNFNKNSITAKKTLEKLVTEIKPDEEDKEKLRRNRVDRYCHYITRECSMYPELFDSKKTLTSLSTMLDVIYDFNIVKVREETGKTIIKNANFLKEIKNRFPSKQTLSKKEPSFEELRKMIILLFSYKFWFIKQYEKREADLEDYKAQIDDLLIACGLQEMYFGNPYDWMFLYCSIEDNPLDVFRGIVNDAFSIE